jgi:hypothetical protein
MSGEQSQVAIDELNALERNKTFRANFDAQYSEIARMVIPRADEFNTTRTPGTSRNQHIFDSTAQLALPSFAAAMESLLTPRTQKWHGLRPLDENLVNDEEIKLYLERKRDLMFRVRYSRQANFASQTSECYNGLGAFGTAALFIEDGLSRGILYQAVPLSELYIEEDGYGLVDTVRRDYKLTARQAAQKFGEAVLPEALKKALEKEPQREFEFVHVCRPNGERKRDDKSYRGMKCIAFDIAKDGKTLLRAGGYRVMPYAVSRYTMGAREVYGRSPAWDAMASIKSLNAMKRTLLRYGEQVADPAWVTADVDALTPFSLRPGSMNPGYMNERGEVLAKSLAPTGDPRITLELMQEEREMQNRSFLVTLFQILVDTPRMTATEALLRAQEKGALLAPTMGRQQSEFLDPIITRELDILTNAGVFDDMPDKLRQAGGMMDVVYDSPLTRAQRAEEGVGMMRTIEAAGSIAQFDPTIAKAIDGPFVLRALRDINGAPVGMIKSAERMAQEDAAEAEQAQLQSLLEAAPVIADTAKTAVEAGKAATAAAF